MQPTRESQVHSDEIRCRLQARGVTQMSVARVAVQARGALLVRAATQMNHPNLSFFSDFGILMKEWFCVDFDSADMRWFQEEHPARFKGRTYALDRT